MWPRNFRRPHESIEAQPSTARCQAPLGARCDHFITSPRGLKLGDVVTFTDDFGVAFSDLKVTGFTPSVEGHGRFVYLDKDSWWFPVKPDQLRLQ